MQGQIGLDLRFLLWTQAAMPACFHQLSIRRFVHFVAFLSITAVQPKLLSIFQSPARPPCADKVLAALSGSPAPGGSTIWWPKPSSATPRQFVHRIAPLAGRAPGRSAVYRA